MGIHRDLMTDGKRIRESWRFTHKSRSKLMNLGQLLSANDNRQLGRVNSWRIDPPAHNNSGEALGQLAPRQAYPRRKT
jgi:hypothetical protein